jgi:hypothetical protein
MLTAVIAVALTAFVITTWLLTIAGHARPGTDEANARLDAVRTGLAAGAAAGAAVGLMLAFRRQHHQEISTALTDHDATERRITELYTRAVEQLGSDKAPVRLGGLYALERLAQDNRAQRQTIVNVICAYLRMPFPPEAPPRKKTLAPTENTAEPSVETKAAPVAADDIWQQEKQVRLTAQRILSDHARRLDSDQHIADYSPKRFWDEIRLDLTGATLIDFSLTQSTVDALFYGATFHGVANFYGATFQSVANFYRATFHGVANFDEVSFNGVANFDEVSFNVASFNGTTFNHSASFHESTFNEVASFREATFTNIASFNRATLNSAASFYVTTFNGVTTFDGASFNAASFNKATFNSIASFRGAIFNGVASFSEVTFNGVASINEAIFNNSARFIEATFSSDARFNRATFNGDARFNEATFDSPNAVNFAGALVRSPGDHVWPKEWHLHDDGHGGLTLVRTRDSTSA